MVDRSQDERFVYRVVVRHVGFTVVYSVETYVSWRGTDASMIERTFVFTPTAPGDQAFAHVETMRASDELAVALLGLLWRKLNARSEKAALGFQSCELIEGDEA